jgi:hypothetical protein
VHGFAVCVQTPHETWHVHSVAICVLTPHATRIRPGVGAL